LTFQEASGSLRGKYIPGHAFIQNLLCISYIEKESLMKLFVILVIVAAIFGMSHSALGQATDFHLGVLDPNSCSASSDCLVTDPGVAFPVTFSAQTCVDLGLESGPVPSSPMYGCLEALNGSGQTITSLDLIIPNTAGGLGSQPASCDSTLFTSVSCGLSPDGSTYDLSFSGGTGIGPSQFFTFFETGADPNLFDGTLSVGVPEGGADVLYLLLAGVSCFGAMLFVSRYKFAGRASV